MKRSFLAAVVLVGLVTGCATGAQTAQASRRTTARAGSHDNDLGDTPFLVSVTLPDLRPPSEIRSDCATYVAWIRTDDGRVRRAGEVAYDARTGRGRIDVLTSTNRFTLLVTAEPSASATEPSLNALVVRQASGTATASAERARL